MFAYKVSSIFARRRGIYLAVAILILGAFNKVSVFNSKIARCNLLFLPFSTQKHN